MLRNRDANAVIMSGEGRPLFHYCKHRHIILSERKNGGIIKISKYICMLLRS